MMQLTADQWNHVGAAASEKGLFPTACHYFRKALQIDPKRHDIRANLADNLRRNWEFDEALVELTYACRDGMFAKAQFIFGCLYHDLGLPEKALKYFTPAICSTPYGRFCRAQSLLHGEIWTEGFAWNESRLEMAPFGTPPMPMWKGEPLDGKIVAIHHEQGYGDSFAYCRWLNQMPKGSYVLGMPSALVGLMASSFDGQVFNTNEPLQPADYFLPIMSLPHRLEARGVYVEKSYICPEGRFDIPTDPETRLKLGIVWRSKAGPADTDPSINIHGAQKSIPLELLLPLGDIPGVTLYSLQTGTDDIKRLGADYLIYDLAAKTIGFNELALFMQEMDIIVSVDTAPLHLAGAMGKRCIGLLACRSGWPYPKSGNTTPWYPSMQLIRQETPGHWQSVVNELAGILSGELAQKVAAD